MGTLDTRDLPELQRARALWARQQWDRAEAEFCRIVEAHPDNWHALLDAARVLGDRRELRRCGALLDRLAQLADGRDELLLQVAQTCRMSRRETDALPLLAQYVSRSPGRHDPAAHLELAVLHERQHRLEEAEASALAALKAAPHWMEALIILARVRRQRGETVRAEAALQRVIREPRVHEATRSQAWAMWADMADRAGDPDVAMTRLERAKNILRPAAVGLADHGLRVLRAWDRVGRDCTPEIMACWQRAASPRAPGRPRPAHLLGFPRSGTTLLENILEAHSGLISSEESQVLGRDLLGVLWREPEDDVPPTVAAIDAVSPTKLEGLRHRYWERMAEGLGVRAWPAVHLDKNPTHTLFIPAILRLLPDSRFLVALRDPRDVVVSCYFQWFPLNPNSASFLTWKNTIDRYLLDMGA